MKNLIQGLAFLSMLSLFSCTKVLYSHEEILTRYQTKKDVTGRFGAPAEIKANEDSSEEWMYKFDTKGAFAGHSSVEQLNAKSVTVTEFSRHKRYIVFSIDRQGRAIVTQCSGLNLEERVKNPGGTIALVAGGVALVALVVVAASSITLNLGNVWGAGH